MTKDQFFQPLHETINCIVKRIVFTNPENLYTVMKAKVKNIRDDVTVVGNILDIRPGEELRIDGNWVNNPKFGRQFQFSHAVRLQPSTVKGIERYLGSGLIEGIGPKFAEKIVDHFGLETLRILNEEPERIIEVRGIGKQKAGRIVDAWQDHKDVQEVMVFLRSYDVSSQNAVKIYKRYGNSSISLLRENPYQLAIDIRGIGFRTADQIARSIGIPMDSPYRAEAGLLFFLHQTKDNGHTFYPRSQLLRELEREYQIPYERGEEAIDTLESKEHIFLEPHEEEDVAVFLKSLGACEAGAALSIRRMIGNHTMVLSFDMDSELETFETLEELSLDQSQKDAIAMAVREPVSIITGGPGTGKTTIIKAVCHFFEKEGRRVLLAAPTGRAAKRMSESTGHPAKTLHRLLEFSPQEYSFQRHQENPLLADVVIVDEVSMIDVFLFYALLRAVPPDAQLLLVGDADQLPSVGPGNVLQDLLESDAIATTRLSHIFRQKEGGLLVENAHRINSGELPLSPEVNEERLFDFYIVPRKSPTSAIPVITELVTKRIPERFGLDALSDIQVISPMHKGEVGVQNLNQVLQQELTCFGASLSFAGLTYYINDRVLQTKNNYDKDVFNGDIGRVLEIDRAGKSMVVDFDGRYVLYAKDELDELQLAYAISVHKSQGSEYPAVILPLFSQHYMMLQRNLLYTAITRGKKLVVVVGTEKALRMAIQNNRMKTRFSRLKERILYTIPSTVEYTYVDDIADQWSEL